jgi:hypothetical protein
MLHHRQIQKRKFEMQHKFFLLGVLLGALILIACSSPVTRAQTLALGYPIADAGQTKCYNHASEIACPSSDASFFGQGAQTTRNATSYTLNGALVFDNVTGLTWERSPDTNGDNAITAADKFSYANALAHGTDPSGLSGTTTSALTPFIDTNYFQFAYGDTSAGERIIDSQYASSTLYVGDTNKVFGVNFADGRIKGYDQTMPGGATKTFFAQCVRGNTSYGVNAFVDNGDQTITDTATGLMWTQADSGRGVNWQAALAWAQTKNAENYLGHNDWRLPNAKELQSILDYSRSPNTTGSAAINAIFNATAITNEAGVADYPWYWSSTTHATYTGMGANGVYLAFGRAGGWQKFPPSATCYTLNDVHGAGAQRSDPKIASNISTIGTACSGGTAYGLGPQGDSQRANNFVRLVRDLAPTQTIAMHYLPFVNR